jgi:hypothetical protein
MSERDPGSSHDSDSDKDSLHIEGLPPAIQLEAIDELRKAQAEKEKQFLDAARKNKEAREKAREAARNEFGTLIDEHLLGAGIGVGDDKYKEYSALLRGYSVDLIPPEKWDKGYVDDDGTVQAPMRQWAHDELKTKYETTAPDPKDTDPADKDPDPVPDDKGDDKGKDDEPEPTDTKEGDDKDKKEKKEKTDEEKAAEARQEKIKELEAEITELQKAKATAFAERLSVSPLKLLIPGKRKELDGAYKEAEEAYLVKLEEYQRMLIADELAASRGESFVPDNQQIASTLNARFSEILAQDDALKREALLNEGGLKAKLLEKYESMSPKQKVALMVGMGAFFLAGGLVITLGVVGGAVAVGGGIALAGAKGTKSYLVGQSRIYAEKDPARLKFEVKDPAKTTPEEALQQGLDRLRSESRKDIKDADKRKKIAIGLGALAIGGGSGLGHLLAGGDGWFGQAGDALSNSEVHAAAPPDIDHAWSVPQVEVKPPVMEFSPDAANLPNGGGGLAETKDVLGNVPQSQVTEVWNQVVPQLQTMDNGFGRPLVYQMENGGFGLRMTADHQMPRAAMEAIANKYNELYGQMPPGVHMSEAATTITESHPIPVDINQPVVTPAEVNQMSGVIKMDTIPYSEIVKPENAALFEKLSYVQQGLDGDNYARALGLPPKVWLESLEPFISDQVNKGTTGFIDTFYLATDGTGVHFTGRPIAPSVLRDMLNQIPVGVRSSLKVG